MVLLLRRLKGYNKIDKEDPEEVIHRRAQFLIYKVLQQADYNGSRRKPGFLRVRLCRLKVRIGKRLKKVRKCMLVTVSAARVAVCPQILWQMRTWRRFLRSASGGVSTSPSSPILASTRLCE